MFREWKLTRKVLQDGQLKMERLALIVEGFLGTG
jgi:hypothetical protein